MDSRLLLSPRNIFRLRIMRDPTLRMLTIVKKIEGEEKLVLRVSVVAPCRGT